MLRRKLFATGFAALLISTCAPGATAAHSAPADHAHATTMSSQFVEPPQCPYAGSHPPVRPGMTGTAVAHLQCLLRHVWGYNIAIDGIFGPATERAVLSHQAICGIPVDIWRLLHPATAPAECLDAGRG